MYRDEAQNHGQAETDRDRRDEIDVVGHATNDIRRYSQTAFFGRLRLAEPGMCLDVTK